MVRNLMLILGVSLSLAAFGCSSDGGSGGTGGGGTGGDGGNGGNGGDTGGGGNGGGGLPSDACTNADDLAIVCDPAFGDEVGDCARGASGDPTGTSECLVTETGVSADCASCYGAVTGCILVNCIAQCATEPDSQACEDCQVENGCDTLQADCTGDLQSACTGGGGGSGGDGGGGSGGAG